MKLRSRDCSRLTTSEMRWSCSVAMRSSAVNLGLAASLIYCCRRMRGVDIVGGGSGCKTFFCDQLARQSGRNLQAGRGLKVEFLIISLHRITWMRSPNFRFFHDLSAV